MKKIKINPLRGCARTPTGNRPHPKYMFAGLPATMTPQRFVLVVVVAGRKPHVSNILDRRTSVQGGYLWVCALLRIDCVSLVY